MAMADLEYAVVVTLLILVTSTINVNGGDAPAPAVDCASEIINLADCLSFVQEGSKLAKPQGSCCSGLKKVVKEKPSCLCDALKSSSQIGVPLNLTKALSLPTACGVSTPSLSNCNISEAGGPVAAPAPSPVSGGQAHLAPTPSPSASHAYAPTALEQSFALTVGAASLVMFMYLFL